MGRTVRDRERRFVSSVSFDPDRIHAAGIYCSDGRFGEQMDEFLHEGLGLPRYDRLALPGGPACFSGAHDVRWVGASAEQQLDFLCRVHGLERLVLIAHQSCAFYLEWLKVPPDELEARQLDDIIRAAARLRQARPDLTVDTYFARRRLTEVVFERVVAERRATPPTGGPFAVAPRADG
jgi:hypothetical protein